MNPPKPVALCILDGWGLSDDKTANAPVLANTPTFDRLMAHCPNATLVTHGPDVGLPKGQMGNSEVGHTNIGAGRVVAMDLGQIDLAIEDGSFAKQPALLKFVKDVKAADGSVHLMGVISDGGVHGHINHLLAAARIASEAGLNVWVHAITDGRDVAPKSASEFAARLSDELPQRAKIATVIGRYYAMDRDNRWERIEQAYRAIVLAEAGQKSTKTAAETIAAYYDDGLTDEFLPATVIDGYPGIAADDGFFCLNFRADRARELLASLADPEFSEFDRGKPPQFSALLGMAEYSDAHNAWFDAVFPKRKLVNTLGAWIAKHGLRQFRLAETEKYPHVTFFLNGGKEDPEEGEDRFMPKSPNVATYDLQPEMSAGEVTDHFVKAIEAGYDLIVTNYANPDMVGHTGDLNAAIAACEAVDDGLGKVVEALERVGGAMIVTADHGNCETMVDPATGGPHTAHTTNPVPVILFGGPKGIILKNGRLSDLAPTLLELMGLPKPEEMTGKSLIQK